MTKLEMHECTAQAQTPVSPSSNSAVPTSLLVVNSATCARTSDKSEDVKAVVF